MVVTMVVVVAMVAPACGFILFLFSMVVASSS